MGRRNQLNSLDTLQSFSHSIQAIGMSYGFNNIAGGQLITDQSWTTYLFIATVLTAGTAFLLWLGEQITANGVGNGISMIIFAGLVAAIPNVANKFICNNFKMQAINYSCTS
ncbi:hypothetical protein AAHB49_28945 [Bacillus cereus]